MNKFKDYFLKKYQDNKILFYLGVVAVLVFGIGLYYNSVRESKTTYNYAVKDGENKTYKLFFQRATSVDVDKKVVKEILKYKYGTIINISKNQAYYISNINNENIDKIYSYDFSSNESKIIYENEPKETINDILLDKDRVLFIASNNLYSQNLLDSKVVKLADNLKSFLPDNKTQINFNEFINLQNGLITIGYDNCKYEIKKCSAIQDYKIYIYDTDASKNKIVNQIEISKDDLQNTPFFGTNKVFRRGTIQKYNNDLGNKNYNIRIFTQF